MTNINKDIIGTVVNVEASGKLVARGLVTGISGCWVAVRELSGLTYEWPVGEVYRVVAP